MQEDRIRSVEVTSDLEESRIDEVGFFSLFRIP